MKVELDILKTSNGFDIWVSDDIGGSGFSVKGTTIEEVSESLKDNLETYLQEAELES